MNLVLDFIAKIVRKVKFERCHVLNTLFVTPVHKSGTASLTQKMLMEKFISVEKKTTNTIQIRRPLINSLFLVIRTHWLLELHL